MQYFSSFQMNGVSLIGAILLLIVLIILLVWMLKGKNQKVVMDLGRSRFPERDAGSKREGFVNLASGATVDPNTQAVKGNILLTDGLLHDENAAEFVQNVEKDPYYAQEDDFGATKKNTFNKLMENQLAIQNINEKNNGNVMSQNDLKSINKKLLSSASNNTYNLFDRAGAKNVKFSVHPSETRGIIDSKYLGWRDRNFSIDAVRRIIPVKGFDISIDRIPEMMQQELRGQLGENKDKNVKRRASEASMVNAIETPQTIETVEEVANENMNDAEIQESFARNSGCRSGLMVMGNHLH